MAPQFFIIALSVNDVMQINVIISQQANKLESRFDMKSIDGSVLLVQNTSFES